MDSILKYFPNLTKLQTEQFSLLKELYSEWNSKINVISRKDIDNIYIHHILHSLAIAKIISFKKGTRILDVGTGGGLPGIPLAILFPQAEILMVDTIAKKIKVVNAIINAIELKNARERQINAFELKEKFDFVVSRAVTSLPDFCKLVNNLISKDNKNQLKNELNNGVIYLKGGDLNDEIATLNSEKLIRNHKIFNISDFFSEPYFEAKKVVWLQLR